MPLTRGRILGYDRERMAFGFSMLNGSEEVECQISTAAIDELAGGPRGKYVDRETQFSLMRETIERLASVKFDTGTIVAAFSVFLRKTLENDGFQAFAFWSPQSSQAKSHRLRSRSASSLVRSRHS